MTTHPFSVDSMFRKILSSFFGKKKVLQERNDSSLKKTQKQTTKPLRDVSLSYRTILILAMVVSVLLVFFGQFFAVVALHGIAVLSRIYYRWFRFSIGIELGIFAITLTAIAHGPIAGIVIGVLHFLISRIITREPMNIVPICLLGYAAVGFFAGILPFSNIIFFGVLMTLIYDLITTPLFIGILNYNPLRELFFIITHILFNYWVFSMAGEFGLKLVGVS